MIKLILVALLALVVSCTPQALSNTETAITAVEGVCVPVVSVAAPADEPLCVLGAELAQAIAQYIAAHAGTAPVLTQPSVKSRQMFHHWASGGVTWL